MKTTPTWFLSLAFALFMLAGCATQRVTRAELDAAMSRHVGATINHMFYMGTRNGEHFLRHQYTEGVRTYRIPEHELGIEDPFPFTRDPNRWRLVAERWWPVHMTTLRLGALDEQRPPDTHSRPGEGVIRDVVE